MRPKIVIALLLAGLAAVAAILFLKHLTAPAQPAETSTAQQEINPAAPTVSPGTNKATLARVTAATNKPADDHEAYVQARINTLWELQTHDDAKSLQAILSELTNSDRRIRKAAVEAAVQFGDKAAASTLRDQAAVTQDFEEKQELLDAAEYLELPTLDEAIAEKARLEKSGARQP